MKRFDKLVRDKIPQIIEASGKTPIIRILDREEYLVCLEKKLDEEVREFHESKASEELADILEVVYALADAYGCSRETLEEIYMRKHEDRGGFAERIFLIGNAEND
ncbi:MAG: phosphoribosyl-ATP pyrophosphohydrolase [Ruminococcaceae bacterium]|nr:phosphoribosyl-ATP pyrophosphohydrolase [Oscillospiraceae bacterium]